MKLILNTQSMVPIYEQIVQQIERMIAEGKLVAGDPLPSVRTLAAELRISALTVKKAYDRLEEEGLTATVHGKGTYVTAANQEMMAEQMRREIEKDLEQIIQKAIAGGLTRDEIRDMMQFLLEE
ncbi:MAG: GntR family transcriptional regulator [Firmicutes bacterium]|nr:GntR family transcriptional regulator [Bacillota bacterium]